MDSYDCPCKRCKCPYHYLNYDKEGNCSECKECPCCGMSPCYEVGGQQEYPTFTWGVKGELNK